MLDTSTEGLIFQFLFFSIAEMCSVMSELPPTSYQWDIATTPAPISRARPPRPIENKSLFCEVLGIW